MSILETIHGPQDVKRLPEKDLPALAVEIRKVIINTVARNGSGHLGPSLGAVELAIALHRVFDSPRDKIIWDVGHQAYAHKLLTGRLDRFHTLRQYGGLSGYLKRSESPHDIFEAGHAGTSVGAALGFASARDLAHEDYQVVAVIGDGAMTSGMSFEALNHAGQLGTHLIVVLNHNNMSIAPNVGALARYLARARTHSAYLRLKRSLQKQSARMPWLGKRVWHGVEKLRDTLKYLLVPGVLFEQLGFKYLGPIPGHDISALEEVLREARGADGPVLVHVVTEKGHGYEPAINDPERLHGASGPFDPDTGTPITNGSGRPSYSQVFGRTVTELAREDDRIVAITAAMPTGTGLKYFAEVFPDRFFDVGIAEQHAVTFAAGLAAAGRVPVVAIYSTFLQRAFDQIEHDVCLQNLHVVFGLDRAGIVGDDGETHQGLYDLAYLRILPNMTVMAPKDGDELRDMLKTALALSGPVAIRYPRGTVPVALQGRRPEHVPVGRAELLRQGTDLSITAIGAMVYPAMEAAALLASEGIDTTVINARFVKPLDDQTLVQEASRTGAMLCVEEHTVLGGFGSAVLELMASRGITVPVRVLGVPDGIVPHGDRAIYLRQYGLDPAGIAQAARELLGQKASIPVGAAERRTV